MESLKGVRFHMLLQSRQCREDCFIAEPTCECEDIFSLHSGLHHSLECDGSIREREAEKRCQEPLFDRNCKVRRAL